MSSDMPSFMRGHEHHGKEESLKEDPEFWRARAWLIGQYRDDPDRLANMLQATSFSHAQSLKEWQADSCDYPDEPLPPGDTSRFENEDVPVRAFILKQAILALFRLADAPTAMRSDIEQLLDSFVENAASVKANVQSLRLEYPDLSWTQICELASSNYTQVMKDKGDWVIAHNPDVGSDPSSTP